SSVVPQIFRVALPLSTTNRPNALARPVPLSPWPPVRNHKSRLNYTLSSVSGRATISHRLIGRPDVLPVRSTRSRRLCTPIPRLGQPASCCAMIRRWSGRPSPTSSAAPATASMKTTTATPELPPLLLKPIDPDQLLGMVELQLSGQMPDLESPAGEGQAQPDAGQRDKSKDSGGTYR